MPSNAVSSLPPPEPLNHHSLSFSELLHLLGSTGTLSSSTGAVTGPTGTLSTGGPMSSLAEEKTRSSFKFGLEEVGSVQTHSAFSYI